MKLEFETKAAEQIYKRVIANAAPEAKSKVDEMFDWFSRMDSEMGDGRVQGGYNVRVNEKEALAVEAALKRHDVISRNALGIGFYDANEVKQTLIDPEVEWWKIIAEDYQREVAGLKTFISNHPNSPHLPEAYYRLGRRYQEKHDFENAIGTHEKLIDLLPKSVQAAEALSDLAWLYFYTSENEKAIASINKWLQKPKYSPRGLYAPPPSYEEERNYLLSFLGECYQAVGKKEEARRVYSQIASGKHASAAKEARGALDFLSEPQRKSTEREEYIKDKIRLFTTRAEYFHYNRRDYRAASDLYKGILKLIGGNVKLAEDRRYIESALEDLKLRRIRTSGEVFKMVEQLEKEGKLASHFEYYTHASIKDWEKSYGIPPKLYFLFLFLQSCKDVGDVRLIMGTRIVKLNEEIKTPKKYYWVMYKTEEGWRIADRDQIKIKTSTQELVMEYLERVTGGKLSVITGSQGLFAKTLGEFQNYRPNPVAAALDLEQEGLSTTAKKMVQQMLKSIKTKFNGEGEEARKKLVTFARAFSILPKSHFRGLESVYFDKKLRMGICGEYYHHSKSIDLGCSGSDTAVHEIAHHWDIGVARGNNGGNQTAGDPSLIYYRISWDKWSIYSCPNQPQPCTQWKMKPDTNDNDFTDNYAKKDGFEDSARVTESYVEGNFFHLSRKQVREQMQKGNFAPAAKYIYKKYVEFYDEEDGLCFEYNLKPDDPPLGLQEVKNELARWLVSHPGLVPKLDVLTSLKESEEYYLVRRFKNAR